MTTPQTIHELEGDLADWHRRRYGPNVDILRTCLKAQEELGELSRALLKGDRDNAREEAADVALCLINLVRGLDGSLFAEMVRKLAVIEERLVKGSK